MAAPALTAIPVHLLRGSDPVLLDRAVSELVTELVGREDRTLVVDELTADSYDPAGTGDLGVGPVVDAAQTPPFLTERRVVVARQLGAVGGSGAKERVAPLVDYLADPLPTTSLVLVWEKAKSTERLGAVPKSLLDAVKAAGSILETDPPDRAKDRSAWLDEQLGAAAVVLDAGAKRAVAAHLGEQVNRLPELLTTLVGAYGPGARLSAHDVEPWLGEAGGVAPWDLTDAIDRGDVSGALDVLGRMMGGGERHPLQLLSTLQSHVLRMVRLDGEAVGDERAAAEALGMKGSTYPAKKALAQDRKLGTERLAAMVRLLAQADLDLRGARAIDNRVVMEVLVARLAQRSRR